MRQNAPVQLDEPQPERLTQAALVGVKCKRAGTGREVVPNRFDPVRAATVADRWSARSGGVARSIWATNPQTSVRAIPAADASAHLGGGDAEGRVQIGGSAPLVVVRAGLVLPGSQREQRIASGASRQRPRLDKRSPDHVGGPLCST